MAVEAMEVLLSQEGTRYGDRRHEGSGGAPGGQLAIARRLWVLVGDMLGQKWERNEAMI